MSKDPQHQKILSIKRFFYNFEAVPFATLPCSFAAPSKAALFFFPNGNGNFKF